MGRPLFRLRWCAFAASGLFALLSLHAQQATFRGARTELVVLPVSVTDSHGGFVDGLDASHFIVFDEKRLQPIAFFSREDAPLTVALVIDSSSSMGAKRHEAAAATLRFAALSHPEDELLLYPFNDSVHDIMNGKPIAIDDSAALETLLHSFRSEGRTALYEAVVAAIDGVEHRSLARKIIIVMSDGGDNASRATLDDVIGRARRSSVTIYTIGLFEPTDPDANAGVLDTLAKTTGGRRFLPRSPGPLIQACEQIAREIRSEYTLGYAPPERDGRYHHVDVRAGRGDGQRFAVRTRPGYTAADR